MFSNLGSMANFEIAKLQYCNIATMQHCNFATLQHCNIETFQHCTFTTLQHCNVVTLQHCNFTTLQHLKPWPVHIFDDWPFSLYIVTASESDEGLVSIRTSKNVLRLRYSQLLDIWALFSWTFEHCSVFLVISFVYYSCLVQ